MKLAAERRIKVLLAGDGADEYLAGYWPAYDRIMGGQIRRGRLLKALKLLAETRRERSLDLTSTAPTRTEECRRSGLERRNHLARALTVPVFACDERQESLVGSAQVSRLPAQPVSVPFVVPHFPCQFSALHGSDVDGVFYRMPSAVPRSSPGGVCLCAWTTRTKSENGQSKYILRRSMEGIVPNSILDA